MLRKIDRIILYSIFGSIPVGLILYFLFCMLFGSSTRQVIAKMDLLENVNGVVDTLFNDDRNHDIRTAILKNKSTFQILRGWESNIEIGDSISKNKGSFLLEVVKTNGKKIILDYRSTISKE